MSSRRPDATGALRLAAFAAAVHVVLALASRSETFFYWNVGTSQPLFGGSINAEAIFDDVNIYRRYADRTFGGSVPYRDFAVEYPPGAMALFLVPGLLSLDEPGYKVAFGALMLVVNAATVLIVARHVARREGPDRVAGRLLWYTGCVAAFGSLMVARFDLVPALLGLVAAVSWAGGRNARGGLAAGLGVLVKIVPGVIAAPALAIEARRRKMPGTLAFAATLAVGGAAWAAVAGPGLAGSLGYHAGRGLELGSTYAGLLMAAGKVTGAAMTTEYVHSTAELRAPGAATVARLAFVAQAAALLAVMIRARKAALDEMPRLAAAAVVAFIVAGKVLSPQYLLWPLPLVAVAEGPVARPARRLFLAASVATFLVYPWSFMGLVGRFVWGSIVLLNLRNGLLLALLVVLLWPRGGAADA